MLEHTRVFGIASAAHAGQADKSGLPYSFHPLAVARIVQEIPSFQLLTEEVQSELIDVALLHDVLEDTDVSEEELRSHDISPVVVDMVKILTHGLEEDRKDYIRRVALHPLARIVKLADLAHNSSPSRLDQLDEITKERLSKKYAADIPTICLGYKDDYAWIKSKTNILK